MTRPGASLGNNGLVALPAEPTGEMILAFKQAYDHELGECFRHAYKAMVKAAAEGAGPRKQVKCTECNKHFSSVRAMRTHFKAKHREPSLGERARQAEIDRNMGIANDDAEWILPDGTGL